MKIRWCLIIGVALSCSAQAKLIGVSTAPQLLRQLELHLRIDIEQARLPEELVSKLPIKNELASVTPSFLTAWTQLTYLACKHALKNDISNAAYLQNLNSKNDDHFKEGITHLASQVWGSPPSLKEVDEMFRISNLDVKFRGAIACGSILASPYAYLIYAGELR